MSEHDVEHKTSSQEKGETEEDVHEVDKGSESDETYQFFLSYQQNNAGRLVLDPK